MTATESRHAPPSVLLWADIASLYREHRPSIYHYIACRVRTPGTTPEEVEDLTAQVFLKAIEAMCSGHGPSTHTRGYLFRVAHNLIVDAYRLRTKRGASFDLAEFANTLPDVCLEPSEQVASAEGCATIWHCIDRLNALQAEVIVATIAGCHADNLGDIVGCDVNAAKGRLHRARVRLRQMLADAP